MKFTPFNQTCNPLATVYNSKLLTEVLNFKFLSLLYDKHLNWRSNIEQLLPKVNINCYSIRKLSILLNIGVLTIVYFADFQFLLEYGIIFWGNSTHIGCTFSIQKRIIINGWSYFLMLVQEFIQKIGHFNSSIFVYLLIDDVCCK